MTVHLVVEVTDELINSISDGGTVTVRLVRGGGGASTAPARAGMGAGADTHYRRGSHPQKLLDWAAKRGSEFGVDDVVKQLGVTRSHASMILNKVVKDTGPIRRVSRGVYGMDGAAPASLPASKPTRRKTGKRPAAKKRTTKKRAKRTAKKAAKRKTKKKSRARRS